MTLLPMVGRELRGASRRSTTYWLRVQIAASAIVPIVLILLGPASLMPASQQGSEMFVLLSYLAFFFTVISAVRLTADCISAEKREGTLGLLFLTDLKPYDVILGKLSATALSAVYGLVALIPVLAIPVLLGGVTLDDLARLTLVLLNTLFFTLSVAIFVSVVSWHERKAIGLTTILLLGFCVGLPYAGFVASSARGFGEVPSWFVQASPGYACGLVRSAAYLGASESFWFSTATTHALGWLFFWISCRMLPRAWQDRPAEGLWQRWREWCRDLAMGRRQSRALFRRECLNVNPVFWLASRERRTVWYPWFLLGSVALVAAFACHSLKVRGIEFGPLLISTFLLNWFFKHWIANLASQAFALDRDKGALELLLSTSLRVEEVLAGHRRAMQRQFLAPVVTMILAEFALFAGAALTADFRAEAISFGLAFVFSVLVLVADCIAATWVGWWASVVAKGASNAISTVYVKLMIAPWFVVIVAMMSAQLLAGRHAATAMGVVLIICWFAISLGADVFFGVRARRDLLNYLRLAAVERYGGGDATVTWWRRLGRSLGLRSAGTPVPSRSAGAGAV